MVIVGIFLQKVIRVVTHFQKVVRGVFFQKVVMAGIFLQKMITVVTHFQKAVRVLERGVIFSEIG